MTVREEIEAMFKWTHPEVGDNFKCATSEPYVVYAIACRDADLAMTKLINTFRILSTGGAALVKPDGAPVMLDDDSPRYLYWKRLPEFPVDGTQRLHGPASASL